MIAVVTHPRIWAPPAPALAALDPVDAWLEAPSLSLLAERPDRWAKLRALVEAGRVAGPLVHEARIAALCLANANPLTAHPTGPNNGFGLPAPPERGPED